MMDGIYKKNYEKSTAAIVFDCFPRTIYIVRLRMTPPVRTLLTHLECSGCRRRFDPRSVHTICPDCQHPLLAMYDLVRAKSQISPATISAREGTLWRYRELLPVYDERFVVSLGEGWTPIIPLRHLGQQIGITSLHLKEEGYNPTGSFKARGLCLAVSKGHELGISEMAMPSAGNAGGALAAYAARAGIRAHVFIPEETPVVNKEELTYFGAQSVLVRGTISDAAKKMNELRTTNKWFDVSTMKEPYRLEGKKTMGYELVEQLGWKYPGVILYPTGGGTGLIGMWKAFEEMEQLGWVNGKRPKMVVVQSSGCAPVVRAFKEHKDRTEFWNNSQTIASGLRVPKPFADELIMKTLHESEGIAIAVDDSEILETIKTVAATEGLLLCPEGAACVAALRPLVGQKFISPGESVVLFNTGSGYKYREVLERAGLV